MWLESRDSSELMDNPGLLQRPAQRQPLPGWVSRSVQGSSGLLHPTVLQTHPSRQRWHIQLPPPPQRRCGRVPAGTGTGPCLSSPAQGMLERGAPSTSPTAACEGAAACRGGRGETAQAAQIDCDSPRKAEPGGCGKIQVSFLFLTICSPSAVGGRIITAIHHAGLACHTGCRLLRGGG